MRRRPESLDHPHCRDICSNLSASIPLCWYRAAEYALRGAAGRATAGQIARLRETARGAGRFVRPSTWHDSRTGVRHPANPRLQLENCGSVLLCNGMKIGRQIVVQGWPAHLDSKEHR